MREQELAEEVGDEEGTAQTRAIQQLQDIRRSLGIVQEYEQARVTGSDPLVDQWEKDIEAGRVPDLDAR